MTGMVLLLVTTSAFLHAGWNFAARKISGNACVVWIGLCMASAISLPFAFLMANSTTWRSMPYILATGIINAIYFFAVAKAYEFGEISQVYPIARGTGVAGAGLLGYFFLSETISNFAGAGILAVGLGIFLLSRRPKSSAHQASSPLFAFIMGGSIVASALIDKMAMRFAEPIVYISGMLSVAAVCIAPYVLATHGRQCIQAWKKSKNYSAVIGLGSLISYLLILIAFRVGSLSRIVAFREMSVVIGSILGVLFLKEPVTLKKSAGIVTIVVGLILIRVG